MGVPSRCGPAPSFLSTRTPELDTGIPELTRYLPDEKAWVRELLATCGSSRFGRNLVSRGWIRRVLQVHSHVFAEQSEHGMDHGYRPHFDKLQSGDEGCWTWFPPKGGNVGRGPEETHSPHPFRVLGHHPTLWIIGPPVPLPRSFGLHRLCWSDGDGPEPFEKTPSELGLVSITFLSPGHRGTN